MKDAAPSDGTALDTREVLGELFTALREEMRWVREEQDRCRLLLRDAVERLHADFDRMRAMAPNDGAAAKPSAFEGAVDDAIQALQFEDIAAQTLAGAEQGLEHLERLLAELEDAPPSRERAAAILREHREMRRKRRNRDVQRSMDSGDVDLF